MIWASDGSARRRRGEQVIDEENEEYIREMTEPWGTPALMECRLERKPSTLTAIDLSERKLPNPFNESLIETKHGQFREKTLLPNTIKGLGDIEKDHSALTTSFQSRGPDLDSICEKITISPAFSKGMLVIREKIVYFKEGKLFSDDGLNCFRDE